MEFPLEGSKPRVDGGRDHCCRMVAPPAGPCSLPVPTGWWGYGCLGETAVHSHISLLGSVEQNLEVHQLPAFCLHPCWQQPPRAWAGLQAVLPGSSFSPSPSPKLTVSTVSQGIHWCSTPPDSQKHSPPSKAQESQSFTRSQSDGKKARQVSPSSRDQGEAPGHVPGVGGHTQVQLPPTGAALILGGIWSFADACCWEHISIVQRVGRWVRALHHPAHLCTASLFSGWKANKG